MVHHMKTLTLVLVSLLFNSFAKADCYSDETFDLRAKYPSIMNDIPIRNQGNYGYCYAYAASFIIDFYRKLNKTESHYFAIDPVAAAIMSTAQLAEFDVEGGEICDVVNGLTQRGYACTSSGRAQGNWHDLGSRHQPRLVEDVFMPFIQGEKKFQPVPEKAVDLKVRKTLKLSATQKFFLEKMDQFLAQFILDLQIRGIPRSAFPSDAKLLGFFQGVYLQNTWASFDADLSFLAIESTCKKSKVALPKMSCESIRHSYLIREVDEEIQKLKPVGINVCAGMFSNPKAIGVASGTALRNCAPHAVAVNGKRKYQNKCQYLIRNSWGSDDVWVNETSLKNNLFGVSKVN